MDSRIVAFSVESTRSHEPRKIDLYKTKVLVMGLKKFILYRSIFLASFDTVDSTENATIPESNKSTNSNSGIHQIEKLKKIQFVQS